MQERIQNLIGRLQDRWNGLERNQKIRLVTTVVVLLFFLGATVFIVTRPRRVVLRSNLDGVTAGEIQRALADENIRSWMTNAGTTVEVDEKNLDMASATLAIKNVPSESGFTYEDALNASGMGTTETIQKENLKKAKQTELERVLRIFDGVERASVQIELPTENNFFIENKEKARAGVVVTLNKNVDKNNWSGVARLIARSVRGLEMENIEIRDQNYNILYSGEESQPYGATAGIDIEKERNAETVNRIKSLFSPLFDDVKVGANVKINTDKTVIEQKTYESPIEDSDTGLVLNQEIERSNVTGANTDGEPGLGSNDLTGYQVGETASNTASSNRSDTNYLHNETKQVTDVGIGEILPAQSSVAIIGYNYRIYNQKYMQDNGLLGDQTWEEFKAAQTYTPIAFEDERLLNSARAAVGFDNIQLTAFEVPQFIDYVAEPLKIEQIIMFAIMALLILLLGIGLIRAAQTEEVTEVEPELSVEDLLVSTQLEEEKESETKKLADVDFERESETKRLIEKFIVDKPESVAQLLRNWLSEDDWNG